MPEPSALPLLGRRDFLRRSMALASVGPMALGGTSFGMMADPEKMASDFLRAYVGGYLPLYTAASEASWAASTDVSEAHTADQIVKAQALNEFVGAPSVITTVKTLLDQRKDLSDLTIRQLEKIRLKAAEAPGTVPEVVKARTEAEAKQSATQDGFVYTLERSGKPVEHPSANEIDRALLGSRDLADRQVVWETSKTIGGPLREGLLKVRDLRNKVARALGFDSFFALQVADYGLTVDQMMTLCDGIIDQTRPLYEHLHTWAKHALAKRYDAPVPEGPIPAHWLPNRWGQNWPSLVEGVDADGPFKGKTPEFITRQAEAFYVSLGFPKLPTTFYEKSDLYPADPKTGRKKNSHASAWHIDLRQDVRSLMSIEPDMQWFSTAHHELGHIYYYMSYSTPRVPVLLREGANRAYHEAIGELMSLASGQRPYLKSVGLLSDAAAKADPVTWLLDTALDGSSIVFLPFSAGVMTHFEKDSTPPGGLTPGAFRGSSRPALAPRPSATPPPRPTSTTTPRNIMITRSRPFSSSSFTTTSPARSSKPTRTTATTSATRKSAGSSEKSSTSEPPETGTPS
jgi:peptidyl-dipeptidase A